MHHKNATVVPFEKKSCCLRWCAASWKENDAILKKVYLSVLNVRVLY